MAVMLGRRPVWTELSLKRRVSTIIAQSADSRWGVRHGRVSRVQEPGIYAVAVEVWRGVLGLEGTRPVDVGVEQRVLSSMDNSSSAAG